MSTRSSTVDSSFQFCKDIAKTHYENFPVGSLLVPNSKREYVYSIYTFARTADDIADSNELNSDEKLKRLDELERLITEKNITGNDEYGFYKFLPALFHTVKQVGIPVNELTDLISAFKQDSRNPLYDKFEDLIDYSSRSANPIGHLVLMIFGYDRKKSPEVFEYSDKICTALQLTNFWQDVSVDLKMDRIYLPKKEMDRYRYSYEDLRNGVEDERFTRLIRSLLSKTTNMFMSGLPILDHTNGRLRLELKATIFGGFKILSKIRASGYRVLQNRVSLSKEDMLKVFIKTIIKKL